MRVRDFAAVECAKDVALPGRVLEIFHAGGGNIYCADLGDPAASLISYWADGMVVTLPSRPVQNARNRFDGGPGEAKKGLNGLHAFPMLKDETAKANAASADVATGRR